MYQRALINENKWRAGRYGIDGSLIDIGKESEVNTRILIYELLDFIDDVVPHLGSKHAVSNGLGVNIGELSRLNIVQQHFLERQVEANHPFQSVDIAFDFGNAYLVICHDSWAPSSRKFQPTKSW